MDLDAQICQRLGRAYVYALEMLEAAPAVAATLS